MRVLRLSSDLMYLSISYDISSTKARNKVVKILESYGFRVQESVFEIQCNQSQYIRMKKTLETLLGKAGENYAEGHENIDSIKFYILSKVGEGYMDDRIEGIGKGYEKIYFNDILIL